MWPGAMPEAPGKLNASYFDQVEHIVDLLWKREIYTIIDLHQDVLSPRICGEGAPLWAQTTREALGGLPFPLPLFLLPPVPSVLTTSMLLPSLLFASTFTIMLLVVLKSLLLCLKLLSLFTPPPPPPPPPISAMGSKPSPPDLPRPACASGDSAGCDAGDMKSCANLGICYVNGKGVPRDRMRGEQLLQSACEAEVGFACTTLREL